MTDRGASDRIRRGILLLPAAGTLDVASTLLLSSMPSDDPGFAQFVISDRYELGMLAAFLSLALYAFGAVALYAFLSEHGAERWALAGMIFFALYVTSNIAATGYFAAAEPRAAHLYLAGDSDAFHFFDVHGSRLVGRSIQFGLDWFDYPSAIFFGAAIWRSGLLPQGAALLAIAFPLLFSLTNALNVDLGAIPTVLLAIADFWVAWSVWRYVSVTKDAHS
jgi:hypothetical protein